MKNLHLKSFRQLKTSGFKTSDKEFVAGHQNIHYKIPFSEH